MLWLSSRRMKIPSEPFMLNGRAQRLRSPWSLLTERHGLNISHCIESRRFDVIGDIMFVKLSSCVLGGSVSVLSSVSEL